MPRLAANLSMMFNEVPFMARFEAARAAGFEAVEMLFPYAQTKTELVQALRDTGLQVVLHNLPPGDWEGGERGIACHPGREAAFREGVHKGLEYAQALGCPQVHCMAGLVPPGVSIARARDCLLQNLRHAADQARAAGIRLLVEPINRFDIPGYFLNNIPQALEIMDAVGSDNLYLQFDIYHAQRTQGELAASIAQHLPRIAHMQLADTPGRHEPGTGEINYAWLLRYIDGLGYPGWIGCEYRPATTTTEGLGWLRDIAGIGA